MNLAGPDGIIRIGARDLDRSAFLAPVVAAIGGHFLDSYRMGFLEKSLVQAGQRSPPNFPPGFTIGFLGVSSSGPSVATTRRMVCRTK